LKVVYPVVISQGKDFLISYVPDLEINTQGKDLIEVIEMTRDAISIWCVCQEDEGESLPISSDICEIIRDDGDIVTLVDTDIAEYRRELENRTVRKNLTLPSWLNEKAEKAGINFSQTLQRALKEELSITD